MLQIETLMHEENYEGATIAINKALLLLLNLYYKVNSLSKVDPKFLVQDLSNYNQELAHKASLVLLSSDIQAKIANLEMIKTEIDEQIEK